MAFGFSKTLSRPKVSPIAIDFGSDRLKLLQIVPGDWPRMTAAAVAVVPDSAREDPQAREAFYAEALKTKLKSHPFKGRRVMLSLPAHQTLVQNLQIPHCEPDELTAQVALHLQERLNVDPARMVIRHFMVGGMTREGPSRQEVVCIGARRDTVMRYVRLAQRCKLEVVGMHSEPPCLPLAFSHVYNRREGDDQQVRCFVDIGGAGTKVVISQGPRMVFAKTIHAAGHHMTQELAQREDIAFTDARTRRQDQTDTPPASDRAPSIAVTPDTSTSVTMAATDPRGVGASLGTVSRPAIDQAAVSTQTLTQPREKTEALDCLVDELQLCVRYYQSIMPDHGIDKLIFLGGEAHNTAVCQTIAQQVRIAAQLGDPFARLARDHAGVCPEVLADQPQPGWAVPYGLCLSKANL